MHPNRVLLMSATAAQVSLGFVVASAMLLGGCGASSNYSRLASGSGGETNLGGESGDAGLGSGGVVGSGGMGGMVLGTGGMGSGGLPGTGGGGTGGTATGGSGSGGRGTGGSGAGGAATGGSGTGGRGTGGSGSGGTGTGGAGMGGAGGSGNGGSGNGGAATGGVGPSILSIDFIGGIVPTGGNLTPAPAMTATETAGFKPVAHWNGASSNAGTLSNLVLSDATSTTAMVNWNSPVMGSNPGEWKNPFMDVAGNARMMNGYLDPPSAATPATITVSGLPATITMDDYDVYVYVLGDVPSGTTRTYRYAIGGTTFTVSQTGPVPNVFPGFTLAPPNGAGNYIVFRGVSGASFTLTATPGTGMLTRSPVNGIQIVSPAGS